MGGIPSNISRVPNLLATQLISRNVTSSNLGLLRIQEQLSSGQRLNRPSDDAVAASIVSTLDLRLEEGEQRGRNLSHASSVLNTIDQALAELNNSVVEARSIASSEIGVGSDDSTRSAQAAVIDSLISGVFRTLNSSFGSLRLFGGERTATNPVERFDSGFRYTGAGEGLFTDLGGGIEFPITIGADNAVGAVSARVRGDVDLNPVLTVDTRLADLRGPSGPVDNLGSVEISIDNGGGPVTVVADFSEAETIGDVVDIIESNIRATDPGALAGGFPGGVSVINDRVELSGLNAGYTIIFNDGASGDTARSLGLDNALFTSASRSNPDPNADLNPRVTARTSVAALNPATAVDPGTITIRNGGRVGTVTVTPATTIGELREAIDRLDIGARLEIDPSGDSINIVNELSGSRLSVEEGGNLTATTLGVRTFAQTTTLSAFNDGRGVDIADGETDPITGLPDPQRNVDFQVTLADGSQFTVDLVPADIVDVGTLLAKINAEAATAGFGAVFNATLSTGANGIVFEDTTGGGGGVSVQSLNGFAAEDLGLLNGTFTAGAPATLQAEDRATVRVDSLFTALIDLRDALTSNDERGITFAGDRLEEDIDRLVTIRALVGSRASRVEDEVVRLEDTTLLDTSIRSQLIDLDYVDASTRFSLLQTQLQAGLQAAAAIRQLSVLDFL
ncbi:MAG: flagellin [Phycisphaerales bacterium]